LKLPSPKDLKKLRITAHLTQKELAEKAGVSQSLVARIEKGTVDPRLSTLKRIVEAATAKIENLVAKDVMHHPVVMIEAAEPVYKAIKLMRKHGISQIPVIKKTKVIGSIQESTLLEKISFRMERRNMLCEPILNIMDEKFLSVSPSTKLDRILAILSQSQPAILVEDDKEIVGIITKIDVISSIL
jgi:predicted transcriptional regulator